MIVQALRRGGLRLIRQHDHALLAGAFAHGWKLERVPFETVLAATLHDFPWRQEDTAPLFDASRGRFYDFVSYPIEERARFYSAGIDDLEGLAGEAVAALTSMHFLRLMGAGAPSDFTARELSRRDRLRPAETVDLDVSLEYLRFFDALSLFVCMTSPAIEASDVPAWLRSNDTTSFELHMPRTGALRLRWITPDRLAIDPFPFESSPSTFDIPVFILPEPAYPSREAALADYAARSSEARWAVALEPCQFPDAARL